MPDEQRDYIRRALVRSGGTIVAIFVVYFVVPIEGDRWWPPAIVGVTAVVATAPLAVRRFRAVMASSQPLLAAAEALALLFAMIVIGFSCLYLALDYGN